MTVSGLLLRVASVVCLLQLPLSSFFGGFLFFDEFLALVLVACFISRSMREKPIERMDMIAIACLLALLLYGLICNIASGVSRPTLAILQDMFAVVKIFACYFGSRFLFEGRDDCVGQLQWAAKVARVIVVAGVICLVLAHLGLLNMLSRSMRLGLHPFEFIYGSPGMLSQYCVLLCVILLAGNKFVKRFFLGLCLVLWASSLRTRAFVMIVLVLFLCLIVFRPSLREKFDANRLLRKLTSPFVLVPAAIVAFTIAGDQIDHYFGELGSARSYLLDGGIRIFVDHFPLGTGFGSYGTEAARVFYSPLYGQYGIDAHWALGIDGSELTDTFWPAIMAQFGAIGITLYVVPLAIMLFQTIKKTSLNRELMISAVVFVMYTIIASAATGVFFSYTITDCVFFIGMAIGASTYISKSPDSFEG